MRSPYVEAMGSYDVYPVGFVGDTHVPHRVGLGFHEDRLGYGRESLHDIHHIQGYRDDEVEIHYGVYPNLEIGSVDDTGLGANAYSLHPGPDHVMAHHDPPMHYFQRLRGPPVAPLDIQGQHRHSD